jgi:hypothetical protein
MPSRQVVQSDTEPAIDAVHVVDKAFARHETFHPRYGWLKKGFDHARQNPDIFLREDATVRLGVGKNMVRAIRYWSRAFKTLEEYPSDRSPRVFHARPTGFGTRLLSDDGWDPYLEHPASYWLLHWHLMRPTCIAPSWWVTFNAFRSADFTDQELVSAIQSFCHDRAGWDDVAASSLKRDVDCLLHMYGSAGAHEILEDTIDSPFTQLELLRRTSGERRHFTFRLGRKESLPAALVLWASLDFISTRYGDDQHAMSLSHLTYDEGSPGRVFRLPELTLKSYLEDAAAIGKAVVSELAGGIQLRVEDSPSAVADEVLEALYAGLQTGKR